MTDLARLDAECWKKVPGFEGYEVSDHGRVRSYRNKNGFRKEPIVMKLSTATKKLYAGVSLQNPEGKTKYFGVHRLVLMAFKGPPQPGQIGCHNDGDRGNNHVSNLRWGTPRENAYDRWLHGTMLYGEKANNATLSQKDVDVIRYLVKRGCRPTEIRKVFGINPSTLTRIKSGELWSHS